MQNISCSSRCDSVVFTLFNFLTAKDTGGSWPAGTPFTIMRSLLLGSQRCVSGGLTSGTLGWYICLPLCTLPDISKIEICSFQPGMKLTKTRDLQAECHLNSPTAWKALGKTWAATYCISVNQKQFRKEKILQLHYNHFKDVYLTLLQAYKGHN